MTINRRTLLKSASLALASLDLSVSPAMAQSTGKTLNLMVPWPAGGPADSNARLFQTELSRQVGVPVLVDNVGGAGGVIGLNRYVQRPQADRGLILVSNSDVISSLLTAPNQKIKPEDFQLLGLTSVGGLVLLVREGLPVRSFDELVSWARTQAPQSLKFGHNGMGSYFQLVWDEVSARTGLTALQVPYKGAVDILRDLATGDLDMAFTTLNAAAMGYPRTRSIAATAAQRNPSFPDLPTLGESSAAAGYNSEGWFALATLRGTPAPELERMGRWTHATMANEAVTQALKARGSATLPALSQQELDRFFTAEVERYRRLLKRLGLLAEPV